MEPRKVSWLDLKQFITDRQASLQFTVNEKFYFLTAMDGPMVVSCRMRIDTEDADYNEFIASYRDAANKSFTDKDNNPVVKVKAFEYANGYFFRGQGISGVATAGTTTTIDYKIPALRYVNGSHLILQNHAMGDTVDFQVVDLDNVLGYGAGLVLSAFATDWQVITDQQSQEQIIVPYNAKLFKDVYIRIRYHSVGAVDVNVRANLFLHEKSL